MAFERFPFFEGRNWSDEVFQSFVDQALGRLNARRAAGVFPPVNIYDDGEDYLVRAELPGLSRDSIDVTVKNDQLTLRGERVLTPAEPNASYHRREREEGSFRRVVTLPQPVNGEQIEATYKNGILEVRLPRVPEAKERRIQIN